VLSSMCPEAIKTIKGSIIAYVVETTSPDEMANRIKDVLSSGCSEAIKTIKGSIKAYVEETTSPDEMANRIKAVLSSGCSEAIKTIKGSIKAYVEEIITPDEMANRIKDVLSSGCSEAIKAIKDSIKVYIETASLDEKANRIKAVLSSRCSDAINAIIASMIDYLKTAPLSQQANKLDIIKRIVALKHRRQQDAFNALRAAGVAIEAADTNPTIKASSTDEKDTHSSGTKRKRAATITKNSTIKPAVAPTAKKARIEPDSSETAIETIKIGDKEYSINCNYEYEDQDITACLNARLHENGFNKAGLPVYALAAVNTIQKNSLKDALIAHNKTLGDDKALLGKRITLIPCNIGNYHWVGLLFEFNEARECIKAEFINSTGSSIPSTLNDQLKAVYPGRTFTERFDLIRQEDGTSCGPCTVENLIFGMLDEKVKPANMAQIRALHLNLVKQDAESPLIPEAVKSARTNAYNRFYDNQLHNRRSFESTRYTALKDSKSMSEAEVEGIAIIASLIMSLDKKAQADICRALALTRHEAAKEIKETLDEIRLQLFGYRHNPIVKEITSQLFGNESELIFNYEYLQNIYKLCASPGELESLSKSLKTKEPTASSSTPWFSSVLTGSGKVASAAASSDAMVLDNCA
ncbi:MAG: hypothetical protein Q7V63_08575, partial [Gammaproteobacteria bacterium]|nr:hypothetical protein [Gammaproteobacteria bacterium]